MTRTARIAGTLLLFAGCLAATLAQAAAAQAKTQGPGFYRTMLGDFEITALSDGTVGLPMTTLMTNVKPAEVERLVKRSFLANPVTTSVNAYLVNTGSKLAAR